MKYKNFLVFITITLVVVTAIYFYPKNTELTPFKGSLLPSIYSDDSIVYAYTTDGASVYFKGQKVIGADSGTFKPIENGRHIHYYGKDRNAVFYNGKKIVGADPQTFKVLWMIKPEGCQPPHYSADSTNVFYEEKLVVGADVTTFKLMTDDYGKDAMNVFFEDKLQEGLDPMNFKPPVVCQYGYGNPVFQIAFN